jgi:5-methylcytosine-specific restriction protein A
MSTYTFNTRILYTRAKIKELVGVDPRSKGGNWDTGYVQHNGVDIIFANVGSPGRTGHDYDNFFDDEGNLHWRGKTASRQFQPAIMRMTSPSNETHVFWRSEERDPFYYEGIGKASAITADSPVGVVWQFTDQADLYAEEIGADATTFMEGKSKQITVSVYERNGAARRQCVRHHGESCAVCGMSFGDRYGAIGEGFIHVHHKIPVSIIAKEYQLDPVADLVPVCPNCHAMLHRSKPPMSIEQLRTTYQKLNQPK